MTTVVNDSDLLIKAVTVASRAPSLHNTQPWQWVSHGGALELHLDRGRIVRNTDADGREAVIGCGAALHHLQIVMHAAGWACDVERLPDPDDVAHLATIRFHPADTAMDAHADRVDAILRRRTDRLPFLAPSAWERTEPLLRAAVDAAGAAGVTLHVLDDRLRYELGQASALTEAVQRFNSGYQAELDWWTAPFEYGEGIP
ncbi:MAG TPA: NAD(P)H nitroreductase, partial [Mycobacterium sp.]|nr:NAD(P)H nitroreductase [Mycobacterium sp.]